MKQFLTTIICLFVLSTTAQEKTFNQVEKDLFPGWKSGENITGQDQTNEVINGVVGETDDKARIFQYIPRIIDLILKFTAPIVVVLVVIAGVKLIIGGEDEEARESAKNFFIYALIGLAFMILSYSIMKVVYNLLAG